MTTTRSEGGLGALRLALGGVADEKEIRDLTVETAPLLAARAVRKLKATLARLQDHVAASTLGADRAARMFSAVNAEVEREVSQATDADVEKAAEGVYPAAPEGGE